MRRFFTAFLFEGLPAADARTDAVYLDRLDRAEIYLGLFGKEYGVEGRKGLSPTEREFDRATQRGKPRLIFVKGTDDRLRHPKMAALVRKAGDQLIRRRFNDIPELTAALYASLVEHLERTGRLRTKPFDAAACPEATLRDLSREKLDRFLARAQAVRGYALPPRTQIKAALTHLNLLDGGLPNHAAVLLFGREPQRFLLTSEVKCLHFHGTEVTKPIPSYQVYKGTVFELVDQALDFVLSKIARRVGTREAGPVAPVEYELPREAVAEAIVNAITHRDYASNASVQVMLFADRLEVWNPGELPPALTIANLRQPHASIPRNPLIAEPMFLAGYAEKAGSGILDMIARCRRAGLPAPRFRQSGGQFVQTLDRPLGVRGQKPPIQVRHQVGTKSAPSRHQVEAHDEAHEPMTDLERKLLAACARGLRSSPELLHEIGYRSRTGNFKKTLSRLLTRRLLEMTIPHKPRAKGQRYRLTRIGAEYLKRRKGK